MNSSSKNAGSSQHRLLCLQKMTSTSRFVTKSTHSPMYSLCKHTGFQK